MPPFLVVAMNSEFRKFRSQFFLSPYKFDPANKEFYESLLTKSESAPAWAFFAINYYLNDQYPKAAMAAARAHEAIGKVKDNISDSHLGEELRLAVHLIGQNLLSLPTTESASLTSVLFVVGGLNSLVFHGRSILVDGVEFRCRAVPVDLGSLSCGTKEEGESAIGRIFKRPGIDIPEGYNVRMAILSSPEIFLLPKNLGMEGLGDQVKWFTENLLKTVESWSKQSPESNFVLGIDPITEPSSGNNILLKLNAVIGLQNDVMQGRYNSKFLCVGDINGSETIRLETLFFKRNPGILRPSIFKELKINSRG